MTIDHDRLRQLAALARLALREEEIAVLAADLSGIVRHMDALREVEPASDSDGGIPGHSTRLRPDEPDFDLLRRPPAELAPAWEASCYVVPRLPAMGSRGGDPEPPS